MRSKRCEQDEEQLELGRPRLVDFLNMKSGLVLLANQVNWSQFDKDFGEFFPVSRGRPALPTRLIVGLIFLKYMDNLSDEGAVERLLHDPYWQYFCGFEYFQHKLGCDPSSLTRWRQRIGEEGAEKLLRETVVIAQRLGILKSGSCSKVITDTTVQEKNIVYPTDSHLINTARDELVKSAKRLGVSLRQSYCFKGKRESHKSARYFHARQYKRGNKSLKKQRTWLGRVIRDVERKVTDVDDVLLEQLSKAQRIYEQRRFDKRKLYSFHEPQVECLSKGKSHKRYEFGNKVSLAVTARECLVVGVKSCFGRPFDGATLIPQIEQVERVTGQEVRQIFVDRGYRGQKYHPLDKEVFISGQRGLSKGLRRFLRRRSAIEPVIGHIKQDHRMGVNRLGGVEGDKINPILSASAFNMRKILRFFFVLFLEWLKKQIQQPVWTKNQPVFL